VADRRITLIFGMNGRRRSDGSARLAGYAPSRAHMITFVLPRLSADIAWREFYSWWWVTSRPRCRRATAEP
jgi:hypothetical protein